jgi:hypothetical protein
MMFGAPGPVLRDAGLVWLLGVIESAAKHAKMRRPGRNKKG